MDASGWIGQDGKYSYASIHVADSKAVSATLSQLTGGKAAKLLFNGGANANDMLAQQRTKATLVGHINQGKTIVFESNQLGNTGFEGRVVTGHAYSLVGYNPDTGLFRIRNPWGVNATSEKPEYLQATFTELVGHFGFWHFV
jgi:hypothetical protein